MIATARNDHFTRSTMPAAGGGKQLRLISIVCNNGDADVNEHHSGDQHKKAEHGETECDLIPHLSVEDEDFLSDLIPSPPFDDLGDMVYDMAAVDEPFVHQEEVFIMEAKPIATTCLHSEKIVKMTAAAAGSSLEGTFVRYANEKDIISVRGFGKSRPGSLKFRELVRKHHHAYQRSDSLDVKRNLGIKIRDELRPGRFLKKDYVNQEGYRVMDEEETLTKIMFAMRDCKTSAPIHKAKEGEEVETKIPAAKSENVSFISLQEKVAKPKVRKEAEGIKPDSNVFEPSRRRIRTNNCKAINDDELRREVSLNSKYLYEHEIAQLDVLFKHGILSEASTLPSRAQEIFVMIQELMEKAVNIRSQDPTKINSVWFSPESQLKIRQQLLDRCRAAMSIGKSPKEFYEHISSIVFPPLYQLTENVSLLVEK